jgi:Lectin C-type domain
MAACLHTKALWTHLTFHNQGLFCVTLPLMHGLQRTCHHTTLMLSTLYRTLLCSATDALVSIPRTDLYLLALLLPFLAADPALSFQLPDSTQVDVYSSSYQMSYFAAEAFCVAGYGHLVTLDSQEKFDAFQASVSAAGLNPWVGLWSGGRPSSDRSQYKWLSGSTSSFAPWTDGPPVEPNNFGSYEGICVQSNSARNWLLWDSQCNQAFDFACEVTSSP